MHDALSGGKIVVLHPVCIIIIFLMSIQVLESSKLVGKELGINKIEP